MHEDERNFLMKMESYKNAHDMVKLVSQSRYTLGVFWASSSAILYYGENSQKEALIKILLSLVGIIMCIIAYLFEKRANLHLYIALKVGESIEKTEGMNERGFYIELQKRPKSKLSNFTVTRIMYFAGVLFWTIVIIINLYYSL